MGLFGAIIGGAMKGYGDGVLLDAKAKRESAQRLLEEERADNRAKDSDTRQHTNRLGEITAQGVNTIATNKAVNADKAIYDAEDDRRKNGYRMGEIGAQGAEARRNSAFSSSLDEGRAISNDERQGGMVESSYTDADGNVVTRFKSGKEVVGRKAGGADGLSAAEKRALEIAKQVNTTTKPDEYGTPRPVTDWKKVAADLAASGNRSAAALIDSKYRSAPKVTPADNNSARPKPATAAPAQGENGSTGRTKSDTVPKGKVVPYVAGARKAPDGHFYVPDPNRPGKYLKVE